MDCFRCFVAAMMNDDVWRFNFNVEVERHRHLGFGGKIG
jgi:hypothetical protein